MTTRLLVVEDYPDLRAAIAEALERNEYVCECVDSAGAIDKLRTNRYEAILLGPRVPIGEDPVMHFILENQPAALPHVVVMTNPGRDDEAPDARCLVLTKPFSMAELLAQVRVAR